jgi:1,4-alpha-glucan branching enzyme
MSAGYLGLVLHAHLPYVRHPEHARHLEERWLFEALLECYLPIVTALDRLERDRIPVALTMSLTPTLADMLLDPLLRQRFTGHLARLEALQRKEERRVGGTPLHEAAHFYREWLAETHATWDRHRGDVISALVGHVRGGRLDLLASAATHAFLPGLLVEPEAIRQQVRVGLRAFEAQTGLRPVGFWLPECAYAPAFDHILGEEGVRFTVLENHALTLARPRPPASVYAPVASPSGIACFSRDLESGRQVWSREEGYPGDPDYREHYRDIGFDLPEHDLLGEVGPYGARVNTGIKYHRVTATGLDLADKALWNPTVARARAWDHAGHFVHSRAAQVQGLAGALGETAKPIVVAPYDAELFGHWWFEGPWFLEGVFRHLALASGSATGATLEPITLRAFLERHPTMVRATPAPSTWGEGGHARVWIAESNARLWRHVHHATHEVLALPRPAQDDGDDARKRAHRQAMIELLLLQSSDWPFILEMRTSEGYANSRARAHGARARKLSQMVRSGEMDRPWLDELARRDDFLEGLEL